MAGLRNLTFLLIASIFYSLPCSAQAPGNGVSGTPDNIQVEIELQSGPKAMEPIAEPRRVRINDRAHVRFLLKNLSPLDVCTRSVSAPTANAETSPAESLVTSIAGLAPFAVSKAFTPAAAKESVGTNSARSEKLAKTPAPKEIPSVCNVESDPEYIRLKKRADQFFDAAHKLVGTPVKNADGSPGSCRNDQKDQAELACEFDADGRQLVDVAGRDYRGVNWINFKVEKNPKLDSVREDYTRPLPSIDAAGGLQAIVDEIGVRASDLHKKFDYSTSGSDGGSPAAPPIVPGALTVSPTALSFGPGTSTQTVQISSGGQSAPFTATAASDTGWLKLSKAGPAAPAGTLNDTAPTRGFYALLVTADATGLTGKHSGSITITGTGAAAGTTIVNVKFDSAGAPTDCDLQRLAEIDDIFDRAKAEMSLLSDNNKTLEGAQATLKTAYMALLKVEDDFNRRKDVLHIIGEMPQVTGKPAMVLVQPFDLGTDRKNTDTGYFACVSDIDGKTATTTNIYYTLLYQGVPHWSASAGFLTSFLGKRVIGITNEFASLTPATATTPATLNGNQVFAITDSAQVQVVPMAFVNYRIGKYGSWHYGKLKEDELIGTAHLSAGFGVNPNTGTNQPEFFFGLAFGLNHLMIHPGIHVGRTENLGGGFTFNTPLASTVTTAPLVWSYHMAFSIGFSVRLAPY